MPAGECCTCKFASNVRDGAEKGVAPHRICDCNLEGYERWVDVDSDEDCDDYKAQDLPPIPDQPAHRWRYIQAMHWWECQDCGATVTKDDWIAHWGKYMKPGDAESGAIRNLIFAWIVAKKREGQRNG